MKKLSKEKNIYRKIFLAISLLFVGLFTVLLSEFFMYVGFIKNNTGISINFFVALSILVITIFRLIINKFNKRHVGILFRINKLLFYTLIFIFVILLFLEYFMYPNFVYSKFSLDLLGVIPVIFVSFYLWIIGFWKLSYISNKKFPIATELLFYIICMISLNSLNTTFQDAIKKNVFIVKHIDYNYFQKMNEQWGLSYRYLLFVKENTEENSSIVIPPQTTIWYATGNAGIVRYFLYPRILASPGYTFGKFSDYYNYDYVLISWGEWPDGNKNDYGWPKEKINAEKIIYWDDTTNSTRTEYKNYDPSDKENYKGWGIIKIKK